MEQLRIGVDEFQQLREAFMGGHTHAGSSYIGLTLENVGSQDLTSSYPAVMSYEKFPMSSVTKVKYISPDDERFRQLLNTKACLFDIILKNVKPKLDFEHPIPRSKCWLFEMEKATVNHKTKKGRTTKRKVEVLDNGRVVRAYLLGMTITEQDFLTYEEYYSFEIVDIKNFKYYEKQYLPHAFVEAVLEFYKNKTELKGVIGEEVNYMISKEMVNSLYGMSVTNPVRDEVEYLNESDTYKVVPPVLEEAISKYNENTRRFLFYPWGVWVTAYARRRLFRAISAVGEDFVYADTDSVKYLHPEKHEQFFSDYNDEILESIQKVAKYHHIKTSAFSPLNKNGSPKVLGIWENEGVMEKFKTLGAKRYFYKKGDEYFATVAGSNKKGTAEFLSKQEKPFEAFNENMVVPAEYSKRMVLSYIDDETTGWVTDYKGDKYFYHSPSAIHMEPTTYSMGMSDEFIAYLREIMYDGWK